MSNVFKDGALAALGYDYMSSGKQAAEVVARILGGVNPARFRLNTSRLVFGLNLEVAQRLSLTIPADLLARQIGLSLGGPRPVERKPRVGVVQFAPEPNVELCKRGILQGLASQALIPDRDVELIYKNAQADFAMISAIVEDLIRRHVDVIVPLSTPCLRSTMQLAASAGT